jgi:hypothetical protein
MSDAPPKLTPDEWLGEFAVAAKKAGWKVHVELATNHTEHDASSAEVETLLATIADQKNVIDQYSNDMVEITECAEAAEVADAAEICGAIQLLQKRVQLAEIKKEELLSKALKHVTDVAEAERLRLRQYTVQANGYHHEYAATMLEGVAHAIRAMLAAAGETKE